MIKYPLVAIDITEIYFLLCVVLLTQTVMLPFLIRIFMHEKGMIFLQKWDHTQSLHFEFFFRWRWGWRRWWRFLRFSFLVAVAGSRPKPKWELGTFLEPPYFGSEVWVLHEAGTAGQCPARWLLRPAEPVSLPAALAKCWAGDMPALWWVYLSSVYSEFDSSLKGLFSKPLSSRCWPQLTLLKTSLPAQRRACGWKGVDSYVRVKH